MQGIFLAAVPIGTILGTALGGYLSAKSGWQTPFYYFAIPGIILGVIAFFLKDYKTVQTTDKSSGAGFFKSTGRLFKVPTLVWIYLGAGCLNMLTFAFLTWLPAFAMRALQIAEDKAGMLVAPIAVATFIGVLLGGWLADIWYRKNPRSRLYMGALASLLSVVTYIPGIFLMGAGQLTASLVFFFLFGLFVIISFPPIQVATQEVVHPAMKGLCFGVYGLVTYLFSAVGPVLVGAVSDALGGGVTGLQYALLVPCVLGLFAILFYWLGSRSYMADTEKIKSVALEFGK